MCILQSKPMPYAKKRAAWVNLSCRRPWPEFLTVLSPLLADAPRRGLLMRLEDLQRVLSHEELMAFGLMPVPVAPVYQKAFSDELAGQFIDHPTVELGPAA